MTPRGPVQGADGDKSLVKLLGDYARRSTGAGFGFHIGGKEQQRRRVLALVCRIDTVEPQRVVACVEAGADAVELNNATATPATLAKVETALTVPWGIAVHQGSFDAWQEAFSEAEALGAAWITLTMADDARFLKVPGVGKVLEVGLDLRPEVLRGIAVSGADVVAVMGRAGESTAPLTVEESVGLRLLCDVVKQPVLLSSSLIGHDVASLRLLRDLGVIGLLLETSDVDAVRALAGALDQMPDEAPARGSR